MHTLTRFLRMLGVLIAVFSLSCAPLISEAQSTGNSTINGTLIDVNNQLPVSGATVTLFNGTTNLTNTTTDANGNFSFTGQQPGAYSVQITLTGYQSAQSETVFVAAGSTSTIRTTLTRARSANDTGLRVIGRTSTSTAGALQTSSTITQQLNADILQREAILRVGDALQTLPGLTSFNLDSAPGDDLNISIRGFRPTDAQTLLDGHPIGPIGIASSLFGTGYNFQLSPSFALRNIQVAYGTGGEALYGTESIAGTINFETLNPTAEKLFTLRQSAGQFGRANTVATATGQIGRLGYAGVFGVEGTYGGFQDQTNTQNALLFNGPGGDLTSGNIAANTWSVSGNYQLRQNLLKLRYDLSSATSLTLQAYNATSWDDKTGEGDNDSWPAEYSGYVFDQNKGTDPTCPAGIVVATDGGNSCFNRNSFINRFSGPYGGSPIAWQALRSQDYTARFTTVAGRHTINVNGFTNVFNQIYNRDEIGNDAQYKTYGGTVSDTITFNNNTAGFGYFSEHQIYNNHLFNPSRVTVQPGLISNYGNFFVRDEYTPSSAFSALATAWVKQSSVTNSTAVDPRISLVFRPAANDVVRFSVGESHADPLKSLRSSPVTFNQTPTNINPVQPPGITQVATGSNPRLFGERAQDIEVSYGHRFGGDTQIQAVAFSTNEYNPIFSALIPLSAAGITQAQVPANLYAGYIQRIIGGTFSNLGIGTAFNAGSGRYTGLNVTGRYRFVPSFFADYGYNLTSARLFGIPTQVLQNNFSLVDGGQIQRVPYQTASLGLDFALKGVEIRLDNYYTGHNNALFRPAYYFANLSASKQFGDFLFNVGISNVFNSQYSQYGEYGLGIYQPENQFGTDNGSSLSQQYSGPGAERFGLAPRTLLFSLTKTFRVK